MNPSARRAGGICTASRRSVSTARARRSRVGPTRTFRPFRPRWQFRPFQNAGGHSDPAAYFSQARLRSGGGFRTPSICSSADERPTSEWPRGSQEAQRGRKAPKKTLEYPKSIIIVHPEYETAEYVPVTLKREHDLQWVARFCWREVLQKSPPKKLTAWILCRSEGAQTSILKGGDITIFNHLRDLPETAIVTVVIGRLSDLSTFETSLPIS